MSIPGQEQVTRRQYAAGTRNSSGNFVPGATTDTAIQMSVQPANGRDMELLPEGSRQSDAKKGYTTSALDTENQHDSKSADRILLDSIWYQVMNVKRERSIIAHYKVLMLRVAES
jgi:hypothetical protein